MNSIEQAKAFLTKSENMDHDTLRDALEELPEEAQEEYWKLRKAAHFDPKNERVDTRQEVLSPSGKYKLVISRFSTGPGSWDYAQGTVYHVETQYELAKVQRNYGSFPFLWVENHPKGNFLICGEDYQGQTVIELDTFKRRDFLPEEAKKGHGFCWIDYEYIASAKILVVMGCIWACPEEYRLYDFSDPMNGWPELEPHTADGEKDWIDADGKKPEFLPDGTIRCFQTPYVEDEDGEKKVPDVRASKTYRRDGTKLVLVEEWVSDVEKEYRIKQAEGRRKHEEDLARFRREDPVYLAYVEQVKEFAKAVAPDYTPEDHESYGITHENWCPDFKIEERRWCRRILQRTRDAKGRVPKGGATIDLDFATVTGPVKLTIFKEGAHVEDKFFFPHGVESLLKAFAYAKEVARG
jgi:hypothetical protein